MQQCQFLVRYAREIGSMDRTAFADKPGAQLRRGKLEQNRPFWRKS